jgi:hypothetical protein
LISLAVSISLLIELTLDERYFLLFLFLRRKSSRILLLLQLLGLKSLKFKAEENVKANAREAEVLALVTDLTSVNLLLEQEVGPCCSVQLYREEGLRRKACSHVLVHRFNIQTHTHAGTNVPR